MPFFLLAKGADDRLSLLSDAVFDSRSEAMAELSRVTSDPAFGAWDDEVLVFELGTGAPVLLMRPAAAVTDSVVAEAAEEPADEPTAEEAPADTVEEEPEDAAVFEAPAVEEVLSADAEPSDGGEVVIEVDEVWAEAIAQTEVAGDEENDVSLKEALLRTASKMESDGIVAPESVGPAELGEPEVAEPEVAEPELAEPEVADEAIEPAVELDELAAEEPAAEVSAAAEEGEEAPAWPWDVAAATEVAVPTFELSPFEEPGNDEMSLVRAPGDDDTMSAARPVIMGAYSEGEVAEQTEEDAPQAAEDVSAPTQLEVDRAPEELEDLLAPVDPASVTELLAEAGADAASAADEAAPVVEEAAPAVEDAVDEAVSEAPADEISDFILDLETTVPAGDAPGYNPDPANLPKMTCNDCVYVETCPRTEGRDPNECGSFQWK